MWLKLHSILNACWLLDFPDLSNKSITKLILCSENLSKYTVFYWFTDICYTIDLEAVVRRCSSE